MIVIDEEKIFDIIETRKPVSVALNGPDGLLPKVQDLTSVSYTHLRAHET